MAAGQRMDNRGPRRQLDLHGAVQERDGGAWTRMMAMQIPGNLVCADLEEGKRSLREDPRALECQPHCSPDSACLILVFPPCILGSRTWLALPLLLCCVGPLHITRTRAHLQSRVRSSGGGTGPVMSSRFKGPGGGGFIRCPALVVGWFPE